MNTIAWHIDPAGTRHAVLELNGAAETFCTTPLPEQGQAGDEAQGVDRAATKICPTCFLITTVRSYNLAAR